MTTAYRAANRDAEVERSADSCRQCSLYACSWPEGERAVTCAECGATLEREHVPTPRERRWSIADLELLARWEGVFYGRGAPPMREQVQTSGRDDSGKQDEKTGEWHRACAVHRRFEAMRAGDGRTHYAVLRFVVFDSERPKFIDNDATDKKHNRLMVSLGWAFAGWDQRIAWKAHEKNRTLFDRIQRVFGQRLYDAAVKAWEVG